MSASTSRPIPNALGTLEEAIDKIKALPAKPSFMIHTGDISHLSKAAEFDDADRIISQAKLDVHYVPGEHDFLDEEVKFYQRPLRQGRQGRRLVQLRRRRRAFHRPRQRRRPQGRRPRQSRRRAARMARGRPQGPARHRRRSSCSPISRCGRSIRNGAGAPRTAPARSISQALRLGDGAQRPHPPGDAEGRRQRHLPHRALDRVPAAGARHRALARTDEGRRRQAAHACSASPTSSSRQGEQRLAIIDTPLQA